MACDSKVQGSVSQWEEEEEAKLVLYLCSFPRASCSPHTLTQATLSWATAWSSGSHTAYLGSFRIPSTGCSSS